jgi:hypothetical protein
MGLTLRALGEKLVWIFHPTRSHSILQSWTFDMFLYNIKFRAPVIRYEVRGSFLMHME